MCFSTDLSVTFKIAAHAVLLIKMRHKGHKPRRTMCGIILHDYSWGLLFLQVFLWWAYEYFALGAVGVEMYVPLRDIEKKSHATRRMNVKRHARGEQPRSMPHHIWNMDTRPCLLLPLDLLSCLVLPFFICYTIGLPPTPHSNNREYVFFYLFLFFIVFFFILDPRTQITNPINIEAKK